MSHIVPHDATLIIYTGRSRAEACALRQYGRHENAAAIYLAKAAIMLRTASQCAEWPCHNKAGREIIDISQLQTILLRTIAGHEFLRDQRLFTARRKMAIRLSAAWYDAARDDLAAGQAVMALDNTP